MKSLGLPWALAACAQVASLTHAAGLAPRDFAYGCPIVSSADASAYRITLPLAIYQGTVRDDLGDLAVFNARGEVVPFFIRPVPADAQPTNSPKFLPLFPLLGPTPATTADMRVTVNAPRVALTLNSSAVAAGSVPHQYLLDARALEEPVAALHVVWEHAPLEFSGRMRIESSDDLDSWRMVAGAAPVASLRADGQQFLLARIELPPTRARFWRLSWVGDVPSLPITKVRAEFAQAHADPGWSSEMVAARQDARRSTDYVFDLGGHLPVERVDLRLAEANSVAAADLYSRKDPRDAWNFVTRARFYRIHTPHGDDQNEPVTVPLNRDRYWLARMPNPPSAGDLALIAAWHPSELLFLAQGNPPFLLAYGSSSSTAARTDLTPFVSDIVVPPATLADAEKLGGAARLVVAKPPFPWRRWILWLVLLGALAALGYMAARLLGETGRPQPPS
jgi:uncharacterized protein DUF3999